MTLHRAGRLKLKFNLMPVKTCQSGGKSGHKWGDDGHCYTGPKSRELAERQGAKIKIEEQRRKSKASFSNILNWLLK